METITITTTGERFYDITAAVSKLIPPYPQNSCPAPFQSRRTLPPPPSPL